MEKINYTPSCVGYKHENLSAKWHKVKDKKPSDQNSYILGKGGAMGDVVMLVCYVEKMDKWFELYPKYWNEINPHPEASWLEWKHEKNGSTV